MAVLGQPLERAADDRARAPRRERDAAVRGPQGTRRRQLHDPAGQLAALIGPNGAGKSSMVNCCTGLYRADGGDRRDRRQRRHPDARPPGGAARRQPHVPEPRPLQGHDRAREPDGRPLPARQDGDLPGHVLPPELGRRRRRCSASGSRRSSASSTSRAIATPTCPTCPTGSRSGSSSGGRSSRTRSSSSSTSR